jgi:hypothetical protein
MAKNVFDNDNNNQLELSYELLYLLRWLVEHESETFKKIVARAVRHGFKQPNGNQQNVEMLQHSIVDFLDMLDTLLIESVHEEDVQKILDRQRIPELDHIDASACDQETVQLSLDKATTVLEHKPDKNPKDVLLKELLKRWKPQKNVLH